MELILDYACVKKLPENPNSKEFGELSGCQTDASWEGDTHQLHRHRSACARDPPSTRPM